MKPQLLSISPNSFPYPTLPYPSSYLTINFSSLHLHFSIFPFLVTVPSLSLLSPYPFCPHQYPPLSTPLSSALSLYLPSSLTTVTHVMTSSHLSPFVISPPLPLSHSLIYLPSPPPTHTPHIPHTLTPIITSPHDTLVPHD